MKSFTSPFLGQSPINNCTVQDGRLNCSQITDGSCDHSMDLGVVCPTYERLYNELQNQCSCTGTSTYCQWPEMVDILSTLIIKLHFPTYSVRSNYRCSGDTLDSHGHRMDMYICLYEKKVNEKSW